MEASNGQEVDELYVGLKKLGFKDALKGAEASSQPLKPSAQSVNKEGQNEKIYFCNASTRSFWL